MNYETWREQVEKIIDSRAERMITEERAIDEFASLGISEGDARRWLRGSPRFAYKIRHCELKP